MSPLFRPTSLNMSSEAREHDSGLLWGLTPSLILHALIIALLLYGSSRLPQQHPDDGAVSVVMVPPPEQVKPQPVPPPKETKVEKPPEPKIEKPAEQNVEKPSPPPSSIEELKPVFQYGAKDSGPRRSLDGSSAQESSASPTKTEDPEQPGVAKDSEAKSAAEPDRPKQEDPASNREAEQDKAGDANSAKSDQQEPQGVDTQDAVTDGSSEVELPLAAAAPQPRPARGPKPASAGTRRSSSADVAVATSQGYSSLPGVRRLYSQGATGDPFAGASMDGVPRDQRAGKLCASALQQRLLDEGYFAGLLPYRLLKSGNVLDVPDATFRTRTAWYRVSFRCEVDANATRVLSFVSRTGALVPQAEWAALDRSARKQDL